MDEKTIFESALEITDPEARAKFLDEACGEDTALRSRLERLLAFAAEDGSFMEHHLSAHVESRGQHAEDRQTEEITQFHEVGDPSCDLQDRFPRSDDMENLDRKTQIGPYTLLREIGEGGMGTVFLAEQKEPIHRRVALKIVKEGMDSKGVLARFDAERRVLSLMDHPNIARVLDAGSTSSGKPYFVMEWVKGIPITTYCDQLQLTISQRLELFKSVCDAVQHAHLKGIVHRDLKPSNVLVADVDGKPIAKVIDFGIAKALDRSMTDMTLFTHIGQIIGTLEYMSPEQAKVNQLDVDTRSDIYSLGVLLFELLTGSTPMDRARLRNAAWDEMMRIIRDEQPPLPSKHVSTSNILPSLAAMRRTTPNRLNTLIRGDLDWIVLKALEKDRSRRYQTCTSFAEDIVRYLCNQPVSASPPSTFYYLTKFVRRNPGLIIASSIVIIALILASVAANWGRINAQRAMVAERNRAEIERKSKEDAIAARRLAERATEQKEAALASERQQRKFAEAIAAFVRDDFFALTSVSGQYRFGSLGEWPLNKNTTLLELLDRASDKLDKRHDLAPETEMALRWMIGVSYRGMGLNAKAIKHLKASAELGATSPESSDTLTARTEWAIAEMQAGNFADAIAILRDVIAVRNARRANDNTQEAESALLAAKNVLAIACQQSGHLDEAIALFEELYTSRSRLERNDPIRINSINNLADSYRASGRITDALPLLQQAYENAKLLVPSNDELLSQTLCNLAIGYYLNSDFDKAIQINEEALELMKRTFEDTHHAIWSVKNNLAICYQITGQLEKCLDLHREVYEHRKSQDGPIHPNTLMSLNNLAEAHKSIGQNDEAIRLHEQLLETRRQHHPNAYLQLIESLVNLASCYLIDEQYEEALVYYEEGLRIIDKSEIGESLARVYKQVLKNNMAINYMALEKGELALNLIREVFESRVADLPSGHVDLLTTKHNLAECEIKFGDQKVGIKRLLEVLEEREKSLGADHLHTLESLALLGKVECDLGQPEVGLQKLYKAISETKYSSVVWPARKVIRNALLQSKQMDQLRLQLARDLSVAREAFSSQSTELAAALAEIGDHLHRIQDYSQARLLLDEALSIHQAKSPNHPRTTKIRSLLAAASVAEAILPESEQVKAAVILIDAEEELEDCYALQADRLEKQITEQQLSDLIFTVDQLRLIASVQNNDQRVEHWELIAQEMRKKLEEHLVNMRSSEPTVSP